MEKEQVVETISRGKKHRGKETIISAKMENGHLPLKKNGKIKMVTTQEVQEFLDESKVQKEKFERLAKEAMESKPRVRKNGKVKFIPNGETGGVDVVEKTPTDPPKARPVAQVFVKDLVTSFSGICTVDTDKNGFTNFRIGKNVQFYAIDRANGFIALSVRDNNAKSGWRTDRVISKEDLENAVETLKSQVQNKQKFASAYQSWFHCPCCKFETQSKDEMTTHLGTHGDD
ncbi:MAG: hypothetical protein MUO82_03585 [Candidatus Thermoplasmatota archaeon]|nr:hypothetical protein [Candidatus Thermoplasmatota archaeon]